MEKKKIILVLKSDSGQNNKIIDFIHKYFFNCSIDATFLDFPIHKSEKINGDYFKNLVTNSDSYYNSTNKYKLAQQEPLSSGVFNLIIDYYDMLITNQTDYDSIINLISSQKSRKWTFLPTLIIPNNQLIELKNVVFVSTRSENTIIAFKKFCYLFPSICKKSETVLLRFMDYSTESEKLLYEYLKMKCSNLSIHKVHGKLQNTDTKAINLSRNTLLVVDKPDVNLDKLIEESEVKGSEFASFWLSA